MKISLQKTCQLTNVRLIIHLMTTTLSTQIKKRLQEKGITVHALEKKAGLRFNSLRHVIAGRTKSPNIEFVSAIADALECSIEDLLGKKENKTKSTSFSFQGMDLKNIIILLEILDYILKDKTIKTSKITISTLGMCIEKIYNYSMKENNNRFSKDFAKKTIKKTIEKELL